MPKKIVSLTASNILRIRAIHIEPTGNVITVGGKNAAGKSSVLNSIAMALGGGDEARDKPIRDGEEAGGIVLDLGDIIVRRSFTAAGNYLAVTTKDGAKYSSPQAMLDAMVGEISFDPLGFTRLDAKKQAEILRKVVGLDFSGLESERARAFEQRTGASRAAKALQARLDALPTYADAPDEETSIEQLGRDLKAAQAKNADYHQIEKVAVEAGRRLDAHVAATTAIESQIMELQIKLERQKAETVIAKEAADVARQAIDAQPKPVDTAQFFAAFEKAEVTNAATRGKKLRASVALEHEATGQQVLDLTNTIAGYNAEKAEQLAVAKFPVPGLSFSDAGVTYNGIPFDQCSSAEQLRVSVAMGIAMNPDVRVVLVRDGSLLDKDSLRIISEMAEASSAQVWIERVQDEAGGCSVFIEDGMVDGKMPAGDPADAFHAYVERDGWPVGLLTPFGGTMLGRDSEIEDELIAELKAAIHGPDGKEER